MGNTEFKKWVAFFSQTGSEILNISESLNRLPDLVVTNQSDLSKVNKDFLQKIKDRLIVIPNKPSVEDYYKLTKHIDFVNSIITLNGYLRIIPDFMCENYSIYNLHPGLITKYPFLKGFNPQEKAFNLKLPTSGSVIHKVTPVLDGGEILKSIEVNIENLTLEEVYNKLHKASSQLWINFLQEFEMFNSNYEKE